MLNDHINSISEAVILSKLNIISKHILSKNELSYIYDSFKEQYVKLISDEHVYEMLKLQAYYNNSNIVFNIQIPIVSKENYSLFHVIPLPTPNNKIIFTKPFLILSPMVIQYFDEKCPRIEGIFYCQETNQKEMTNKSLCQGNIINNKPAYCELHPTNKIMEIFQPEPNYILLINVPATFISTTCGPKKQKVQGTTLIHFSGCEIRINDIVYNAEDTIYWDEIKIIPTIFKEINLTSHKENITIKTLNTYQFMERDFKDHLTPYVHRRHLDKVTGILTIPFVLIIIICIIIYLKLNQRFRNYRINDIRGAANATPTNEPVQVQFHWPSFLRGEELRH